MTTKEFKKLLEYLEEVKKDDDMKSEAIKEFYETMYPDSYAPFYEGKFDSTIKTIEFFNKNLGDELSYYFYEARNMKEAKVIDSDGESFDFTKEIELIRYLQKNNIITK